MALRLIETVDAAKYDSEVQSLSAVEVFLDLLGDFPMHAYSVGILYSNVSDGTIFTFFQVSYRRHIIPQFDN